MIRNTDKRHAGDVPAAAEGTAATVTGLCCAKPLSGQPKRRKQPERYTQYALKLVEDILNKKFYKKKNLTGD
jgi:hypothetical protein